MLQCKIDVKGEGRVTWTMDFGYSRGDEDGLVNIGCRKEMS
jgi:hypothetical protein